MAEDGDDGAVQVKYESGTTIGLMDEVLQQSIIVERVAVATNVPVRLAESVATSGDRESSANRSNIGMFRWNVGMTRFPAGQAPGSEDKSMRAPSGLRNSRDCAWDTASFG